MECKWSSQWHVLPQNGDTQISNDSEVDFDEIIEDFTLTVKAVNDAPIVSSLLT
tara:strand:+ start:20 stop:181 length:162 start_codon:yes stop_codon:yes gene_type:complete